MLIVRGANIQHTDLWGAYLNPSAENTFLYDGHKAKETKKSKVPSKTGKVPILKFSLR